ncbi:MAG TPA: phosphatase PAP2 family protein [Bryobacteraceae bacterium]|nr:phosphatase PAP2 family protein [Bryobacteraceae bacterium]
MPARIRLRRSEWLLTAYFCYTAVVALVLPLRAPIPVLTVCVNAVVVAGFGILATAESLRKSTLFSMMRDWYPAPLMLLAYREMGWFAPSHHSYTLEQTWVRWDKMLLNDWGVKAAIEALGPVLPALLEISYTLVYTIPVFSVATLYAYRHRARVDRFLTTFLLGTLVSYALFPYFPSEPPRTVFPMQDFPSWETPFRRFNWELLGGYGIHTSVFPSAHVSGAFSGAFAMIRLLPERRWVGRSLTVLAALIATATVYGRYHYAADAFAGLGVAVAAEMISRALDRRGSIKPL